MKTAPPHLPAACPQCRQLTGQVRAAATVVGQPAIIRLTVRCDKCAHHWHVDRKVERPHMVPGLTFLQAEDLA